MLPTETLRDLLGRPLLCPQQLDHVLPQPRPGLGPRRPSAPARLQRAFMSGERSIPIAATVAADLPPDRRAMKPQPIADQGIGLAPLDPQQDLGAVIDR